MEKRKKDIHVLEAILKEIDRAYIPKPEDQDRIRALKTAIKALELCPYFKTLDE